MKFRLDIDEVMERTKEFYKSSGSGSALLMVDKIETLKLPPVKPLNEWGFPGVEHRNAYLDACIEKFEAFCKARINIGLNDDLIPTMAPFYGVAEFDGFMPGEIIVTEDTTWHMPYLHDIDDMNRLKLTKDEPWYDMLIGGLEYLADRAEGRYAVRQRGYFSPLDLARSMRDSEILMDYYDYPEKLKTLLEFCVEASKWWVDRQQEVAGRFYGGSLVGFGIWMDGNSIGHMSEDASVQCSSRTYEEFGLPYTVEMTKGYDGSFIHTHPAGSHNFESICKVPNLKIIDIYNDPNYPRGIEMYKKFAGTAFKGKIVHIYPNREEITQNLDFLKTVKTIIRYEAVSEEDALDMAALIRRELPVKI